MARRGRKPSPETQAAHEADAATARGLPRKDEREQAAKDAADLGADLCERYNDVRAAEGALPFTLLCGLYVAGCSMGFRLKQPSPGERAITEAKLPAESIAELEALRRSMKSRERAMLMDFRLRALACGGRGKTNEHEAKRWAEEREALEAKRRDLGIFDAPTPDYLLELIPPSHREQVMARPRLLENLRRAMQAGADEEQSPYFFRDNELKSRESQIAKAQARRAKKTGKAFGLHVIGNDGTEEQAKPILSTATASGELVSIGFLLNFVECASVALTMNADISDEDIPAGLRENPQLFMLAHLVLWIDPSPARGTISAALDFLRYVSLRSLAGAPATHPRFNLCRNIEKCTTPAFMGRPRGTGPAYCPSKCRRRGGEH